MQDDETNKPKSNAIYPSSGNHDIPHYQREANFKGKDGDSFIQTGAVVLAVVIGAIGVIVLTLHYLV
jgi:hypothetical protein